MWKTCNTDIATDNIMGEFYDKIIVSSVDEAYDKIEGN